MYVFFDINDEPMPGAYCTPAEFITRNNGEGFYQHEKSYMDIDININQNEITAADYDPSTIVNNAANYNETLAKSIKNNLIRRKRKNEYPKINEFVDAYYHKEKGDNTPMEDYISSVETVKIANPFLV